MEGILRKPAGIIAGLILVAISSRISFAGSEPAVGSEIVEIPSEAVSKKILDNGLVVLAKESPPAKLVAINIKIRAGSSMEEEYLGSGISHLVEHMVFKGTKTKAPGQIEREVKAMGAIINGSTNQDVTGYNMTAPSQNLRQSLALLKDMLLNASFDPAEFEKEKEVILKELRMDNDDPQDKLTRSVFDTSYLRHTYKYPPIGYEGRFRALTREDALKYYNRMYVPNRMVVAVVGGVGADEAVSSVEAEFKDFRSSDYSVTGSSPAEPNQIDARRLEKPLETNLAYLAMAYHSMSISDEDLFAMDVLSMILGRGNNSRLNTALFKEKRLVHSITSWNFTPRDPGLFAITAVLDPSKLAEAEASIKEEISKLRTGQSLDEELETAKRMVLSDYMLSLQAIDTQAEYLATNMMLTGSYDFSARYVKGIQAVSKEDVKSAAELYLRDDNLNVVRVVPQNFSAAKQERAPPAAAGPVRRDILANGLRVIVRQDKKTPSVALTIAIGGGISRETPENSGISNIAARMLLKGTLLKKEADIAAGIERLGGSIRAFNGFNGFGINVEFLKPDTDQILSIVQDIIRNSTFPQEELDKEKGLAIAMISEEDDDIFQRGINALRKTIFPDSPYGFRYLGNPVAIRSLKTDDVAGFYSKCAVPNNIVIAVSGDVELKSVLDKTRAAFGDLQSKELPARAFNIPRPDKINVETIEMQKEQSLIAMGFMTSDLKSPDRYPLEILSSVMSGNSGRLFESLRSRDGFAYALGCAQKMMVDTGFFILYTATTKDKVAPTEKVLLEEMALLRQQGVTDDELALAKRELITNFYIKSQSNAFVAQSAALDELYGLMYDNIFKYPAEIEKVTKEGVSAAANKYFNPNAITEVLISQK